MRAYQRAARTIENLGKKASDMVAAGDDLTKLEGIGDDLAQKIETLVTTGTLPALDEKRKEVPPGLLELLRVPQLGPKRAKLLYEALGVDGIAALKQAAKAKRVRTVKGFGAKSEAKLLDAIGSLKEREGRHLLHDVTPRAEALVASLGKVAGTKQVIVAGSYRRRRETVGDLDILATASDSAALMEAFTGHPDVADIVSQGNTRSTVILHSGLQVDLRVVPDDSYGAALYYFTGSKAHNIALRKIGVKKGLKINEYGVFKDDTRIGGAREEDIPRSVGLPLIPPELREDRGEIDAARADTLPHLVTVEDIRGDLHSHTKSSDGRATMPAMVHAAQDHGYDYLAITDHSPRTTIANGLDPKRLREQCRRIDDLNDELDGFRVFKGAEVDILKDGSLDYPDDVLAQLDVVVCSIHFRAELGAKEQTERVLTAMENEHADILGHPTGRLIDKRNPMGLDMERIMQAAADDGWFVELNAQPDRMDLNDTYVRMAKEYGVKVAIDTDAHSTGSLDLMPYGVDQARRGWLEKNDVLNTRTAHQLEKLLAR